MIESIEINSFRCFKKLGVQRCAPINVVVGDNGAGKTALLEAIFLALCTNPQKGALLRQWRGNDPQFSGAADAIIEALYAELFHKLDFSQVPEVRLRGKGPATRSLRIMRRRGAVRIPSGAKSAEETEILSPIVFEWTDVKKKKHRAGVKVTSQGIEFESTGEVLPTYFFYAAQAPIVARENADRFTDLRRTRRDRDFVRLFTDVFDWVDDISVESSVGTPVLSASVRGPNLVLPLTAVSGGVNRMAAILLAIAHRPEGIVLVDEVENGVFFTKYLPFTRAIVRFAREYGCQLFLSTHSQEWLRAFAEAAGPEVADIALWRIERTEKGPAVTQFSGSTFKAGIELGAEVRREAGADEDVSASSHM
jgi:predicted ATPase